MKPLKAIALLSTLVAASGCFTMNAQMPGTLRNDVEAADTEKIGALSIEKTNWFYLLGLVGAPDKNFFAAEIQEAVQAKGGDGVANLKYEAQHGCGDLLITGCTIYILAPRTYKVTGDIVRIKKPALPGRPLPVAPAANKAASASTQPSPALVVATAQQF